MMAEGVAIENMDASNEKSMDGVQEVGESSSQLSASLLIVIGELANQKFLPALSDRLSKGLSSASDVSKVNGAIASILNQKVDSSTGPSGEQIYRWTTATVSVQVLINPALKLAKNAVRDTLAAKATSTLLLYAGHSLAGNGNWMLRDGTLSFGALAEVVGGVEVAGNVDICTPADGDWTPNNFSKMSSSIRLRSLPPPEQEVSNEANQFAGQVASYVEVKPVSDLLERSNTVGVIPFQRPTMYLFPGGDGVGALVGIRGFVLLVDGGYARRTSCWDFVRHIDRIDATIVTHVDAGNALGPMSLAERFGAGDLSTSLGVVYLNGSGGKPGDPGSLQLTAGGVMASIVEGFHATGVQVSPCLASPQPVNLYHKIGFGSLDMYVLNPSADGREYKEMLSGKTSSSLAGIAFVIVFRPAKHSEHPVRFLFPGCVPQSKLFEGLDKLKNVAVFQTASGLPEPKAAPAGGKGAPATGRSSASVSGRPATSASTSQRPATTGASRPVPSGTHHLNTSGVAKKEPAKKPESADSAKKEIAKHPTSARKPVDSKPAAASTPKKELAHSAASPKVDTIKSTASPRVDQVKKNGTTPSSKKTDPHKKPGAHPVKAVAGDKKPSPGAEAPVVASPESAKPEGEGKLEEVGKTEVENESLADTQPLVDLAPSSGEDAKDAVVAEVQEKPAEPAAEPKLLEMIAGNPAAEPVGEIQPNGESENSELFTTKPTDLEADGVLGLPEPSQSADPIADWEPPQGVPPPADESTSSAAGGKKSSAKPAGTGRAATGAPKPHPSKSEPSKTTAAGNSAAAAGVKKSSAPLKPVTPFYVDLAYVPITTGSKPSYDVDFFRRIRAGRYVIPGAEISCHPIELLLEGKTSTWPGDGANEARVIPGGDTEGLAKWIGENRERLAASHVVVEPSVVNCTLSLEQATSCTACRIEF